MLKFRNALILFTALTIIVFVFTSCGRKGDPFSNELPTIAITSYEGDTLNTEPLLFQQTIYWEANDPDGVVDKYAFGVVDENGNTITDDDGNPVGTPGYPVVDEDGYVYHYMIGADKSVPLSISTERSIWTDQVYAVINFPANVNGDSAQVTSIFQVKCKDNTGAECETPAWKYYNAESRVPTCNIKSSKGDINGETIGTGIVFTFNIIDHDQFVGNIPDYYEFKFEKRNLLGQLIEGDDGYSDTWWSTQGKDDVSSYFISLDDAGGTQPALKLNDIENGVAQDSTYLIAKVIDLSGIVSEPDTIAFIVREGFYPNTLIYSGIEQSGYDNINDIVALGSNHYIPYNAVGTAIPSYLTPSGSRYAIPFWIDKNGDYTCLQSNDLKIYLKWGYQGEYEQGNRGLKLISKVYDELTSKQYFSAIKYYDLRLDGQPYHYDPLPASEYNILDEETGKEWLRVPVAASISQATTLTGLSSGAHKFEARAVDLQNEPDKTPSEFVFYIVDPIPASEQEGILIIDDTGHHNTWAPESIIDSLYSIEGFFAGYTNTIDHLNRVQLLSEVFAPRGFTNDVFSPTDLQQYKTVVYYSDYYDPLSCNIHLDHNALGLYLEGGGNLIISGCSTLADPVYVDLKANNYPFLQKYFGINYQEDGAIIKFKSKIYNAQNLRSYFVQATSNNTSFEDISFNADGFLSQLLLPNFDTESFGPVAYFPEIHLNSETTEVLYYFGCKEAGDGPFDPSNEEVAFYAEQPVGIKNTTANNNKCYLFGFPLSYMNHEDVSTMLMHIIDEIEQ